MRETFVKKPRESMPALSRVAVYWARSDEMDELFPEAKVRLIGWGEPCCFRCGWLAPTKEAAEYPSNWKDERVFRLTWDGAKGWLERAHLQDHEYGGEEVPENLVPLCVLCHEQQPCCRTRAQGVEFVNSEPDFQKIVWLAQIFTDEHFRGQRNPGRSKALRSMLRAHSVVGQALARRAL